MTRSKAVVALACILAGLSITGVTVLQQRATHNRDAEVSLSMVVNDFNALQGLPWKADVASGGDPALARRLMAAAEGRVYQRLGALGTDHPVPELTSVQAPLRKSIALFERIRELAAQGNDTAAGYLQYKGQPTADRVLADLLAAERAYRAEAATALTLSFIGSAVTIVLLLVAFAFFYLQALRARALTERLARDNERLLEASREEATTDALTGLRNRRALKNDLADRLTTVNEDDHKFVLAVFDLDGFKQYNDTFGHSAGDALLSRLGERLKTTLEGLGTAYRMGGDEFCVLAEVGQDDSEAIAPLAAAALSERGDAFSIGCSYGVAVLPDDALDAEQALGVADQRMYAQKASGRASASRQSADVLVKVLGEQNPDLEHHITDVAHLAQLISERLEMAEHEVSRVRLAAELHDVGKAAIPDAILDKPGPLDEREWAFMRRHTIIGERIVQAAPSLAPTAPLIRSSHERVDGTGYPDGLPREDIPLGSRIIAVCDAFDAMTTTRAYRPAMGREEALAELRRCAGTQFDPEIVEIFCGLIEASTAAGSTALPHVRAVQYTGTEAGEPRRQMDHRRRTP